MTNSARVGSLITNANFWGDSSALCWVVPRTLPSSPPHWQHPPRRGCCLEFVMEVDSVISTYFDNSHAHCIPLSIMVPTCRLLLHLWGGTPQSLPAQADELSDCLLPTVLRSCGVVVAPKFICICCQVVQVLCCLMLHRVISCHIMLLLAEPHSPTFLFAPHPSPSALATRCHEGRGGHQGCRASGSARDLGHGRHNGTSAR